MPRGRIKGSKNKATLLREGEIEKALKLCEGHAALEAPKIVMAMAEKAKEGDVAAAKLILDRVMPAKRQVDDRNANISGITINITSARGLQDENATQRPIEGEAVELSDGHPDGQIAIHQDGGQVVAIDGGEEGERPH